MTMDANISTSSSRSAAVVAQHAAQSQQYAGPVEGLRADRSRTNNPVERESILADGR